MLGRVATLLTLLLLLLLPLALVPAHAEGRRNQARAMRNGPPAPRVTPPAVPPAEPRGAYCSGTYGSSLAVLTARARRREASARYTFCLRARAVYQCPFFGVDGRLRMAQRTVTRHGTGFAFRRARKQTFLATNEHVSEWPLVTATGESVEGVPAGCRRLRQTVTIVDNESDRYAGDDITLNRVVADAELDVAILRGNVVVPDIPFSLGQSAALNTRDAVQVRGFPLGVFQATSVGKVINPRARDEEDGWDHSDMVIDAQLSSGNSGSPVLAVNCKTGEFDLVGIYHAAYRQGQGLNVAVGIDDFRNLLITLKPRPKRKAEGPLTLVDRRWLHVELAARGVVPWLPFGGHAVQLRTRRVRIYYEIYTKGFPLTAKRLAVIEDLPSPSYGRIGRLWLNTGEKLVDVGFSSLPAPDQHRVLAILTALRGRTRHVLQYRRMRAVAKSSRIAFERMLRLKRQLERGEAERQGHMKALIELATRAAKLATASRRPRPKPKLSGPASRPATQPATQATTRPASFLAAPPRPRVGPTDPGKVQPTKHRPTPPAPTSAPASAPAPAPAKPAAAPAAKDKPTTPATPLATPPAKPTPPVAAPRSPERSSAPVPPGTR